MKVKIELDSALIEDEVIIRCAKVDEKIHEIQKIISASSKDHPKLNFYKEDKEYYIELGTILFFETSENRIDAHTITDVYQIKYRLYELENLLPPNFVRISKSTIINADKVLSITRNLTSFNLVEFYKTHKQVYVSRFYYKNLKNYLKDRRNV